MIRCPRCQHDNDVEISPGEAFRCGKCNKKIRIYRRGEAPLRKPSPDKSIPIAVRTEDLEIFDDNDVELIEDEVDVVEDGELIFPKRPERQPIPKKPASDKASKSETDSSGNFEFLEEEIAVQRPKTESPKKTDFEEAEQLYSIVKPKPPKSKAVAASAEVIVPKKKIARKPRPAKAAGHSEPTGLGKLLSIVGSVAIIIGLLIRIGTSDAFNRFRSEMTGRPLSDFTGPADKVPPRIEYDISGLHRAGGMPGHERYNFTYRKVVPNPATANIQLKGNIGGKISSLALNPFFLKDPEAEIFVELTTIGIGSTTHVGTVTVWFEAGETRISNVLVLDQ